jgi:hypothetical protein
MNRTCGSAQVSSSALWKRGAAVAAVAVLVGIGGSATGVAESDAAGGAGSPNPQALWRAYPLDPAQTDPSREPAAGKARTPSSRGAPAHANSRRALRSGGHSFPTVWLAIGVTLLAALVGALLAFRRATTVPHWLRRADSSDVHAREGVTPEQEPPPPARESALTATLIEAARNAGGNAATSHSADDVLKRKSVATNEDAVAKLKGKARISSPSKVAGAPRDDAVLKAKLARQPAKPPPLRTALGRPAAEQRASSPRPANVAVRRPGEAEPRRDARAEAPASCRIGWWRGYISSEFHAKVQTTDGEALISRSRPFPWRKGTPPPKGLQQAADAHATLVSELEAAGWVATGCGDDWYSLELQRRPQMPRSAREGEG